MINVDWEQKVYFKDVNILYKEESSMRQEDKFILELLMPNTDWSSNEKLNNTLDWDYIIHHCTQHKLLPVLYNRIRNALQIPQYIVQILDNEYKIRKHIYSKQRDEFLHLLNELDKAGLKIILLKGVYLAEKCYNDPDRKSTRLNSSHTQKSRMPSSA